MTGKKKPALLAGTIALLMVFIIWIGISRYSSPQPWIVIEKETPKENLSFFGFKVGQTQSEELEELIRKFEAENPGYRINYEAIGNADGYLDILYRRIDSGETDDLFMLNPFAFAVAKSRGYIGKDICDLKNKMFLAQYNDTIRSLLDLGGHVIGVPMEMGVIGLFVNKDMLDKFKLKIPENLGEFRKTCGILKEKGIAPIVLNITEMGFSSSHILAVGRSFCVNSQNSIDTEAVRTGKKPLGEIFRPGMELVAEFNRSKYFAFGKTATLGDWSGDMEAFVGQRAAFLVGATWQIARINKAKPPFKYEFVPLPIADDGGVVGVRPSSPVCVSATGRHIEVAMRFLAFISKKENIEAYTKSQTALSPLKDPPEPPAELVRVNEAVRGGRVITDADHRFGIDLVSEFFKITREIIQGKKTVNEEAAYLNSLVR